jgi:dipeptidyl aminopeptidase/acylaminoacyl peptidase/uncharacterized protein (DUF885 family)
MSMRKAVASIVWVVLLAGSALAFGQEAVDELDLSVDSPQQRGGRGGMGPSLVFKDRVAPRWFADNARFWYRNDLANKRKEFVVVDAEKATRTPAFDHDKLASALSGAGLADVKGSSLPFDEISFVEDGKAIVFEAGGKTWRCDLGAYAIATTDLAAPMVPAGEPRPLSRRGRGEGGEMPARDRLKSPDGKWTAFLKDHDVYARSEPDGKETRLSDDGSAGLTYGSLSWSPDSQSLVAFRSEPGDRQEVYLVQSSPPGGGRAKLQSRPYPLPGDKFDAFELNLFDVAAGKKIRPEVDRVDFGRPRVRWRPDGRHFTYTKIDRGHQRYRVVEVDSKTGQSRNLIDEKSETFVWTAHAENLTLTTLNWLDKSDEIVYVSERDGWRHLYLIDAARGEVKNLITKGEYVVRGIDRIDEEKRQVWFRASGKVPGQDPYFLHYYRINFDGTGLVALTEGDGTHTVQYSPDQKYLIDTYSRVDLAPVSVLRRTSDGSEVCKLEEGDVSALMATGWKPPEVFVAKARDGKTDIWGIICRPKDFDPKKRYPVIESIYAGPQGSFVPKNFSPFPRFASLADLGFIVVQMDGMGTANRSKAFHDVCWKNLKDAGFPDRILWHQAAAKVHPEMDLTRVGIYGTSAGGQNSTGGVLFHPEFYKVAVSACGCHDNRMDKASWNEQWMGYPVGPQYAESSNIDNAYRLKGKLLLIVGEMDTNVPPESTYRLCDALIRANKDFDFLMVPNADHGMGGAYGQRRLNDFFVRHLLTNPPSTEKVDAAVARTAFIDEPKKDEKPKDEKPKEMVKPPAVEVVKLDLEDVNLDKSEIRGVIERHSVDLRSFQRMLPPASSPARDEQVRDFANKWLAELARLDFYALSQDGQVDYILFKNYLKHDLESINLRIKDRTEAAPFVTFGQPILDLDEAKRDIKPQTWSKVATTLTDLTKEIGEARKALEARPRADLRVRKAVANRALANVEALRATLRDYNGFYDGYDPLFSWWNAEPYKAADAALQSYATLLRDRLGAAAGGGGGGEGMGGMRGGRGGRAGGGGGGGGPGGGGFGGGGGQGPPPAALNPDSEIIGNPIGREALLNELAYEMIPYSPEELVEIAEREFAWCETEMKKASREMGFGDDWKAALEKVKTLHVEPGQQPAMIRDLALEAIDYVEKNDLVTIPPLCRDSWRMAMMAPERQLVNPFFTGGETITISYPVGSMTHEQKMMTMRGNNVHFSRATVHHELIPGHHLEGYMSSRYKTYRSPFQTAFVTEGWALYWELLLWDRGFARSPEDRVGMLFWRMHRCARIIFSLGFHLEKMTPKECIDFLVDRVGHERDNAAGEVRRSFSGGYGPLYQAAYLLGGMQLRALHVDLVESGKMTDKAFHDAILKENRVPVEMIRAVLTKQKLGSEFISNWKFKGDIPAKDKE